MVHTAHNRTETTLQYLTLTETINPVATAMVVLQGRVMQEIR